MNVTHVMLFSPCNVDAANKVHMFIFNMYTVDSHLLYLENTTVLMLVRENIVSYYTKPACKKDWGLLILSINHPCE